MTPLPRWRIAAGCLVLAAILFLAVLFAPVYVHNLQFQNYVDEITHRAEANAQSDAVLRTWVLQKAHALALPVSEDDVQVIRSLEGLRIDVRYVVTVHALLYTVNLHFYPGAGSR